jgi:hypothetical protein
MSGRPLADARTAARGDVDAGEPLLGDVKHAPLRAAADAQHGLG